MLRSIESVRICVCVFCRVGGEGDGLSSGNWTKGNQRGELSFLFFVFFFLLALVFAGGDNTKIEWGRVVNKRRGSV